MLVQVLFGLAFLSIGLLLGNILTKPDRKSESKSINRITDRLDGLSWEISKLTAELRDSKKIKIDRRLFVMYFESPMGIKTDFRLVVNYTDGQTLKGVVDNTYNILKDRGQDDWRLINVQLV